MLNPVVRESVISVREREGVKITDSRAEVFLSFCNERRSCTVLLSVVPEVCAYGFTVGKAASLVFISVSNDLWRGWLRTCFHGAHNGKSLSVE